MKLKNKKGLVVTGLVFCMTLCATSLFAQMEVSVENRVRALENYVDTFQPTLLEFSNGFEKSITQYANQLESNLQEFSQNLETKLNERLNVIESRKAFLDVRSGAYQKISTTSGSFLIAVKKVTPIDEGVRVTIELGNPNFADYKDFKLKLFWGESFNGGAQDEYARWKASLVGAEFAFQGRLEKGLWNEVQVDLVPADSSSLEYLEAEMEVASIELKKKGY